MARHRVGDCARPVPVPSSAATRPAQLGSTDVLDATAVGAVYVPARSTIGTPGTGGSSPGGRHATGDWTLECDVILARPDLDWVALTFERSNTGIVLGLTLGLTIVATAKSIYGRRRKR